MLVLKRVTEGKKRKRINIKKEHEENNIVNNEKKLKQKKELKKSVKRKKTIKKFFLKIFVYLLLLIFFAGTMFYYKIQRNGGGIQGLLITVLGLSVENIESLERINILLLGISEDVTSNLADTIMICSYNPKNQSASLISIPRDTFIGKDKSVAKGSEKINYLYSKGPEKMLEKVSEICEMEVNYYVIVKTQALTEIINMIGGVNFDVPINMDYDDPTQDLHIHLKKGMQLIDGKKAEYLLRFRHNNDGTSYPAEYGDNDYGRMKTQRSFIKETIKQSINIKNVLKAKEILNTIFNNIETNIEIDDLKKYIPLIIEFDINSIMSNQIPGKSEKCNDLWFFIQDKSKTKELIKSL